jgi:hypothetical protein
MDKEKFELDLAAAYVANARMNLDLARQFVHIDGAGFDVPSLETLALINEALRSSLCRKD